MSDEFIAKITGCNISISFFEGEPEPVIVLTWHPLDSDDILMAISPENLEAMLPAITGAMIRARVVAEMTTIYPEKREEILQNIMFRWAGQIVEEDDGS